jgi:hypothetical protein
MVLLGVSAAPLLCLLQQFYEAVLAGALCLDLLQSDVTLLVSCELDCFEE